MSSTTFRPQFATLYNTALVSGQYVRVIGQDAATKDAPDLQLLVVLADGSRAWVVAADVSPVL